MFYYIQFGFISIFMIHKIPNLSYLFYRIYGQLSFAREVKNNREYKTGTDLSPQRELARALRSRRRNIAFTVAMVQVDEFIVFFHKRKLNRAHWAVTLFGNDDFDDVLFL